METATSKTQMRKPPAHQPRLAQLEMIGEVANAEAAQTDLRRAGRKSNKNKNQQTGRRILAPVGYPWRFNSPKASLHDVSIRSYVPLNKISRAIEGATIFNPFPPVRFDLIHAFNRIPLGNTPFVIGFESHLPRAFGLEQSVLFRSMSDLLVSDRCRRIIAISQYAHRQFLRQHRASHRIDTLRAKLEVRYPNILIPAGPDAYERSDRPTTSLLFVGNHFARKGGCVALRMAELADRRGTPVLVTIVSSLQVGSASWVGPTRPDYYTADFQRLKSLRNVTYHSSLPNRAVFELIKRADFVLLPTFSDSFGFSAIEAMAHSTPVIATDQGALPEFIEDGVNGVLLDLDKDEYGEWAHVARKDRGQPAYEALFANEVERLALEALNRVELLARSPTYADMRRNARLTAEQLFDAGSANAYWDRLYAENVI